MKRILSILILSLLFVPVQGALAEKLILPDYLERIEDEAFMNCVQFSGELVIPESVTYIGERAFAGCTGLKGEVKIPRGVQYLAQDAFEGCTGITVKLPQVSKPEDFSYEVRSDYCVIKSYKGDPAADIVIPSEYEGKPVREIGTAFMNRSDLTGTLTIPDSVWVIRSNAFLKCSGLTGELILPDSIQVIDSAAFQQCSGFTGTLKLPDSLTHLGSYAFSWCSGFDGELKIPQGLEKIGDYAFAQVPFGGELSIPGSVKSVGECAFSGCKGFSGILEMGYGLQKIGKHAFYNCRGFAGVSFPVSLQIIGEGAFKDCRGFSGDIVIPDSVTSLGKHAFANCETNGYIVVSDNLRTIPDGAFYYGSSKGIVVPPGVRTISYANAFDMLAVIYGSPGSYAQTYANELRMSFCDWDTGDTAKFGRVPVDCMKLGKRYVIDGEYYHECELIRSYNGIEVSQEEGKEYIFYLDNRNRVVSDHGTLLKLQTIRRYADAEETIRALIAQWKSSGIGLGDTASKIMQTQTLYKHFGSVIGDAFKAIYAGNTGIIAALETYVADNVIDSDKIEQLGMLAYIDLMLDHFVQACDEAESYSAVSGDYRYERVVHALELYKYANVSYQAVQSVCLPIVQEIAEKYSSGFELFIANLGSVVISALENASAPIACAITVWQGVKDGDVNRIKLLQNMLGLFVSQPVQWTTDYLAGACLLYEKYANTDADAENAFIGYFYMDEAELIQTEMYRTQMNLAK